MPTTCGPWPTRCGAATATSAEALRLWEPAQLELGRALLARTRDLGEGAQFRGDWVPGDLALTFGLREPGDSADMRVT